MGFSGGIESSLCLQIIQYMNIITSDNCGIETFHRVLPPERLRVVFNERVKLYFSRMDRNAVFWEPEFD